MGSFAYSAHVRVHDPASVVNAIRLTMRDELRTPAGAHEAFPQCVLQGQSTQRVIRVCAQQGWVAILDSNIFEASSLASAISRRLDTSVLWFAVNDSDSWQYDLFCKGMLADHFDSSGEVSEGTVVDMATYAQDVEAMTKAIEELRNAGSTIAAIQQKQIQQDKDEMPPDIRDLRDKIATGTASREDTERFSKWVERRARAHTDKIMAQSPLMTELLAKRAKTRKKKKPTKPHFEKLRSILRPSVSEKDIHKALSTHSTFAENDLRQFMELLGINPFFANLSYEYSTDLATELKDAGVNIVEEIRFPEDGLQQDEKER